MTQHPLVSVVIVCHNDWPHLELALDSVLNQTYPNLEVIVVDNASTDKTEEQIALKYRSQVKYLRQSNVGAAGGRNTGVQHCRGEFVQFLDGDDFLAPNKIAKQVAFFKSRPNVDIAFGNFRCFRNELDVPADSLFDCEIRDFGDMKTLLLQRGLGPPMILLFRRRVISAIGDQDPSIYNEDYEYLLRAAFAGFQFGYTDDVWSFYRRRKGQKSENRAVIAEADTFVLEKARQYVAGQPYETLLQTRLTHLRCLLAHYYLWSGDRAKAREMLGQAMAHSALLEGQFNHTTTIEWLTRLPGGSAVYAALRRLKRLTPPFAANVAPCRG